MKKAANAQLLKDRIAYVTAFALSSYSSFSTRKLKPFNPIQGETFDYISEDGWKFHAEQISHHPPISSGTAVNDDWEWSGCLKGDVRLTMRGELEVNYSLPFKVRFLKSNELFTWKKVVKCLLNGV